MRLKRSASFTVNSGGLRRLCGLLLVGMALVMTGCGSRESGPIPTFTPIFSSDPTTHPINAETCPRKGLEQWIQRGGSIAQEFALTINNNLATPPDQYGTVLDQLISLRSLMEVTSRPACAERHYLLLAGIFDDSIRALDAYRRGGAFNLLEFVTATNTRFDEARQIEADLDTLFRSLTE